jgi:hypothetical protein
MFVIRDLAISLMRPSGKVAGAGGPTACSPCGTLVTCTSNGGAGTDCCASHAHQFGVLFSSDPDPELLAASERLATREQKLTKPQLEALKLKLQFALKELEALEKHAG